MKRDRLIPRNGELKKNMTVEPTPEETERAILDAILEYKPSPDSDVPLAGVQMKAHERGVTSQRFSAALGKLYRKGWLEAGHTPTFVKVTAIGYKKLG
jgi:hypothetical protein